MNRIFRIIIVISLAILCLKWILPFFDYLWLDQTDLDLLNWSGHKSMITISPLIYWIMFAIWILLSLGMFFYNKLARTLFVAYLVVSFMLIPVFGYSVQSPLYLFLSGAESMLDGALIAIAFLTTVDSKFEQ
jgi:hypothetical protein